MRQAAALVFAFAVSAVWGQLVIDTKSGLNTDVEDDVYLNGQKWTRAIDLPRHAESRGPARGEGSRRGAAESLHRAPPRGEQFSPHGRESDGGRPGGTSDGSAVVRVGGKVRNSTVTLSVLNQAIPLFQDGVYRFDMADPPRVRVFSGSLAWSRAGRNLEVKAGSALTLADDSQKPVSFDRRGLDALDLWSRRRQTFLAKSSAAYEQEKRGAREVQEAATRAASVEIDNSDPTQAYHKPRPSAPPIFPAPGSGRGYGSGQVPICGP